MLRFRTFRLQRDPCGLLETSFCAGIIRCMIWEIIELVLQKRNRYRLNKHYGNIASAGILL